MAFIRIRTIAGKQYRYLEERYREGRKVRSRSTYLGPASSGGGGLSFIPKPVPPEQRGWAYIERLMEKYPAPPTAPAAAAPVPVEKPPTEIDLSKSSERSAAKDDASEESDKTGGDDT